jgi:hypothetical protein
MVIKTTIPNVSYLQIRRKGVSGIFTIRQFAGLREKKQYNTIIFSIVLVVIIAIALVFQFISLYLYKSIPFALITNVLILIVFLKGLRDNYEIKEILVLLKAIEL